MNTLPILVKPYVRDYFLRQEKNSSTTKDDSNPIIERRHWFGRVMSSIISFHPLDNNELPDDYRLPSKISKLVTMDIEVTFPVKVHQLDNHHFLQMGYALESMFEQHLIFYCLGYFSYVLNCQAAVNKFFAEYEVSEEYLSKDAAYKMVERYYKEKKESKIKSLVGK